MLILDTVDQSLELVLAGAVATTQLPYISSYVDVNQSTFASNGLPAKNGTSNGTTPVTVVSAPSAGVSRKLNYFSTFNTDTAPSTVIIQLNDTGTTRITLKVLIAVGDQIEFTSASGWRVLDSTGALKQSGSQGIAGIAGIAGSIGSVGFPGEDGADSDFFLVPGPQGIPGSSAAPRVTAITSSSTPTPDADTTDLYDITALATAPTFGAPTGTPVNGQKLIIRIKSDATPRALAWNAIYVAGGIALPTTTVASKILTIGYMYNTANSLNKWCCIASAQEA